MRALIRFIVLAVLLVGLGSNGRAFQTEGIINADFSYRNLLVSHAPAPAHLSGLLTNRSDRAHLGVRIFFMASDCVTGRIKAQAVLYIENIDPLVEIPFKIPLNHTPTGYICRFKFRAGYNILPVTPVPVVRKQRQPQDIPAQPQQAAPEEQTFYSWIDNQGLIQYSASPPEGPALGRLRDEKESTAEPIYAWTDRNGVTRYSDTPPEPAMLLERHYHAMQSAKNIEAYLAAMRQWIWGHWLHPGDRPALSQASRAVVNFTILPDGRIRNIQITNSSEDEALDESFYNAVAKSDPLPPLPTRLEGASLATEIEFRSAKSE